MDYFQKNIYIYIKAFLNFFEDNLPAVTTFRGFFPPNLHGDRTWCYLLVLPGVALGFPGRETFRKVTIQRGNWGYGMSFLNPMFFLVAKMRETSFLPCLFFHRESKTGNSKGQIWELNSLRRPPSPWTESKAINWGLTFDNSWSSCSQKLTRKKTSKHTCKT